MKKTHEPVSPDYIFETSWEVCNHVGGIYTVLSTRAATMQQEHPDKVIFFGPDWGEHSAIYFAEDQSLFPNWQRIHNARIGRWKIPGSPIAILLRWEGIAAQKDAIYGWAWEKFQVQSHAAYGDYDESSLFGYAAGQDHCPKIGTLFTTHATSIGRSIAGNHKPLYDQFNYYNGDQMAYELNMVSKHSAEKQAAHYADCFTTVSDLTARECKQLLDKQPDIVTPNGFEPDFVPVGKAYTAQRKASKEILLRSQNADGKDAVVAGQRPFLLCIAGRHEWKNKGLDVFVDSMRMLSDKVNIGMGPIQFSNRTMKDDHSFAKGGVCTVQEVIEQSSNKGTAVLVTKNFAAHPEKYVDGLYALGLNKKIGTGITGEAQPVIKHPDDKTKDGRKLWSNVSLPWMSIGYEVNVTPMQLLMLYNAIANGGRMMKPPFVTEIRRGEQTVERFEPIVLSEHIASPESIEKIQTMLEGVVLRGTARRQFAGCVVGVAGKTGTAPYYDKVQGYAYHEPGIGRKLYNTTFVGYFPTDKPRYSCIIMVSRARGAKWAAGGVSAPGFREIAEKVYATRIGVSEDDSLVRKADKAHAPVIVRHDKESYYLHGIDKSFNDYAINGDWVTVERGEDGQITMREAKLSNNRVPNVVGMDITDAVYLLENMGISTEFTGQGVVKEQSLHAGDTVKANSTMYLKLEK